MQCEFLIRFVVEVNITELTIGECNRFVERFIEEFFQGTGFLRRYLKHTSQSLFLGPDGLFRHFPARDILDGMDNPRDLATMSYHGID